MLPGTVNAAPYKITTPLNASHWYHALLSSGLLSRFHDVPTGIASGFKTGVYSILSDTFIPANHKSALQNPFAVEAHISKELRLNRYSGPFSPSQLQSLIGHFRTAPLGVVPKPNSSAFRIIQDLSFPRGDDSRSSVNSEINSDLFPCEWGTFAQCFFLAAKAPPGTQVAIFDVDSAYRNIPIHPEDQPHFCIAWNDKIYIDHCVAFGSASSAGLFGRVADAFVALIKHYGVDEVIKWVDDLAFFRYAHPTTSASLYSYDSRLIFKVASHLGLPWKLEKHTDFSATFRYLGFHWDLLNKLVSLPTDKASKFLNRLKPWTARSRQTLHSAQQLLGSLNHVCYVLPLGRSKLHYLRKFTASFSSTSSPFMLHSVSAKLAHELDWWRATLQHTSISRSIALPTDTCDARIYVDASTTWGVGVLINNKWAAWELAPYPLPPGFIGTLEMLAVEFTVYLLSKIFPPNLLFIIHSDNRGVIGALNSLASRSASQNEALARFLPLLFSRNCFLSASYVQSAANPADPISRGFLPPETSRLRTSFVMPPAIKDLFL